MKWSKNPEPIFKYREYNKYEVLPCFSFIYHKGIFIGPGVTENRYWKDLPKYQDAFIHKFKPILYHANGGQGKSLLVHNTEEYTTLNKIVFMADLKSFQTQEDYLSIVEESKEFSIIILDSLNECSNQNLALKLIEELDNKRIIYITRTSHVDTLPKIFKKLMSIVEIKRDIDFSMIENIFLIPEINFQKQIIFKGLTKIIEDKRIIFNVLEYYIQNPNNTFNKLDTARKSKNAKPSLILRQIIENYFKNIHDKNFWDSTKEIFKKLESTNFSPEEFSSVDKKDGKTIFKNLLDIDFIQKTPEKNTYTITSEILISVFQLETEKKRERSNILDKIDLAVKDLIKDKNFNSEYFKNLGILYFVLDSLENKIDLSDDAFHSLDKSAINYFEYIFLFLTSKINLSVKDQLNIVKKIRKFENPEPDFRSRRYDYKSYEDKVWGEFEYVARKSVNTKTINKNNIFILIFLLGSHDQYLRNTAWAMHNSLIKNKLISQDKFNCYINKYSSNWNEKEKYYFFKCLREVYKDNFDLVKNISILKSFEKTATYQEWLNSECWEINLEEIPKNIKVKEIETIETLLLDAFSTKITHVFTDNTFELEPYWWLLKNSFDAAKIPITWSEKDYKYLDNVFDWPGELDNYNIIYQIDKYLYNNQKFIVKSKVKEHPKFILSIFIDSKNSQLTLIPNNQKPIYAPHYIDLNIVNNVSNDRIINIIENKTKKFISENKNIIYHNSIKGYLSLYGVIGYQIYRITKKHYESDEGWKPDFSDYGFEQRKSEISEFKYYLDKNNNIFGMHESKIETTLHSKPSSENKYYIIYCDLYWENNRYRTWLKTKIEKDKVTTSIIKKEKTNYKNSIHISIDQFDHKIYKKISKIKK